MSRLLIGLIPLTGEEREMKNPWPPFKAIRKERVTKQLNPKETMGIERHSPHPNFRFLNFSKNLAVYPNPSQNMHTP